MDRIDAKQAREHLAMIERILSETQPRLCSGGEFFVLWGLVSAYLTLLFALVDRGALPPSTQWSALLVLLAAGLYSALHGRALGRTVGRASLVQREFFNVLWLTIGVSFVVNVAAFRIFGGLASAAIWSVAAAIVLLFIGMHGNRRARVAGVLVVVSLVAANFAPAALAPYVLAAGMLVGYTGFGLSEIFARA